MDTKKLRQKILDLAIRGKLVPQDPNDEPASVLLERIRAEKERLIQEGKIKRSKKSASDDEIEAPFEIPESWIACKLEDIAYIGTGATPDTRNNDYYYGNIPWVSSSCTKYDYIDTPTSYITQKAIDETNCRIYPKGTLIMAMYGEGKTRGQISELKIDAATNQACAAIVPYNISTDQYIKLYLKRSYLHIREQAEGGTQPNLNLSKIAQYDIYLPPLSEQKRIINEIERWFTLIDELESNEGDLLKTIDKAKSKILDLAIHGKLVPQDPSDEPAIELLKRIRAEKERLIKEGKIKRSKKSASNDEIEASFEIPESWEWVRLDDLAFYKKGPFGSSLTKSMFVPDTPDAFKVYEQKNAINKNATLGNYFIDAAKYKELIGFAVLPSDIIVSCAGTIGETYILPLNIREGIINQALMLIRLFDIQIMDFYLLYFDYILKNEAAKESKGTAIKNIPPFDVLKNFLIPLPPYAEQLRIVAKIEELFAVLDGIKESLEV